MYEVRLGTKEFSIASEDAIKNGKGLLIEDIPS
jgi:dynein heavy chain, axonemal